MKERPILFSGPMVRAILDGRKTQTRRVADVTDAGCSPGFITPRCGHTPRSIEEHASYCPYGQPGDRLWVRETWCNLDGRGLISYRADDPPGGEKAEGWMLPPGRVWRPSIHMPRRASRITLELTDVRVEPLQSVTYIDAKAEGTPYVRGSEDPREMFAHLWDSINGKRPGCSWADDPWVWVLSFRRLP